MRSSIVNFSGISIIIGSPRILGSVMTPVMADTAAVSTLTRYTFASLVLLLPSKFLLEVRRDTAPVDGACPTPTQGPQAHSRTRAPDATMSARTPFLESIYK